MGNPSISEFKEAISTIKARGIVKNNILKSNAVYRYDFKNGRFKPYDKNKLYKLFNRLYLNSYDVNYSIDAIINELDALDFNQVENYYKYNDAINKGFNLADLENKTSMFLKLNDENKKEVISLQWKPQSQLQQLINNDVFSNGKILCEYNKTGKYFDKILPNELHKFFRNVKNKHNISAIGLSNNYGYFVNNLVNIGGLYDDLREYNNTQKILTKCKSDYEIIKNVIDNFC